MKSLLSDAAKKAEFIYGRRMEPCKMCGSYEMRSQMPIKMEPVSENDTARDIIGKWARATANGETPLEGPVYLECRNCFHRGPAVDCTGRTSEDVRKDREVSARMKCLWNLENKRKDQ